MERAAQERSGVVDGQQLVKQRFAFFGDVSFRGCVLRIEAVLFKGQLRFSLVR
jgi:hypothetical protein